MKYLILGAGPAGLAFGNYLRLLGENDFLILEKEKEAGGLCRSKYIDGNPIDIGGGHFLDIRQLEVNQFLYGFMPRDEWNEYERNSQIEVKGQKIGHPFEANIWQMDLKTQVQYLKSIAKAGCNIGTEMPTDFVGWITWKLGQRIAEDYMIPYNSKMFGEELNELGTYWLEKLPNVSFEETLMSCLERKAYGKQPGHAHFLYPKKYGYGELWLRMADAIKEHIKYEQNVIGIDFEKRQVRTDENDIYASVVIITTIPWKSFQKMKGIPIDLVETVQELKHKATRVDYFDVDLDTDAHWIYYPDLGLPYHRILVRHNFYNEARGYWTETNDNRIAMANIGQFSYVNEYAYPLNTIQKPYIMDKLLKYGRKHGIYGLGRWGEHSHYNSDVTVERAINLAKSLCNKVKYH